MRRTTPRTPPSRAARTLAAAGTALLLATACTAADAPSDPPPTGTAPAGGSRSPADVAAEAVEHLRAVGADPSQVEILQDGVVTFEEYEAAMLRSLDCIRDLGYDVRVKGTKPSDGVEVLDFEVWPTSPELEFDNEEAVAAVDACHETWSAEVDAFWQVSSPGAIAFAERRDAAVGPALRACLEDHGVTVAEGATMHDMILASGDLQSRDPDVDCLDGSGYFTWQG